MEGGSCYYYNHNNIVELVASVSTVKLQSIAETMQDITISQHLAVSAWGGGTMWGHLLCHHQHCLVS